MKKEKLITIRSTSGIVTADLESSIISLCKEGNTFYLKVDDNKIPMFVSTTRSSGYYSYVIKSIRLDSKILDIEILKNVRSGGDGQSGGSIQFTYDGQTTIKEVWLGYNYRGIQVVENYLFNLIEKVLGYE